jgi:hypothetical protein
MCTPLNNLFHSKHQSNFGTEHSWIPKLQTVQQTTIIKVHLFDVQEMEYIKNARLLDWTTQCARIWFNPFRSYVGPRPILWFSCSRRFSWSLTLSNPIFLPPAYSPALIYCGWERGWWITCNYPTVLKEKNRKSTTCTICWLKSVLHEEKHREQENHNVGQSPTLWLMFFSFKTVV